MKTKELIKLLINEDPTGEEEVYINNQPVWYVHRMPSYYDGRCVKYTPSLPVDETMRTPDKMDFLDEGVKIEIMYYEWRSAMWDSDGEIELGNCSSDHTRAIVEEERRKVIEFRAGCEERQKSLKEKRDGNS